MSKIQKALEILRKRSDSGPKNPKLSTSTEGVARARVRTRDLPEDGAVDEQLPEFKLSVDLEELRNHGLQPRDEYIDFVGQQFRRIKRPVLNTAFGLGVPDSDNANVIMLASALPKTGKSFCAFNLATSIARERDVGAVIVDADVLKPSISRAFGLEDRIGLIDFLLDSTVSIDDILVGTDLHGIIVVPAGRQHEESTELLASRRMRQFVKALAERFRARAIIVDTPPLLLTNEAHVLAENMGQIILVIEAGVSSQESALEALGSLNRSKPINAILNKARGASFGDYGGGGYGYYGAPG